MSDWNRFWSKVSCGDGCWIWIAAKNPKGYGHFWSNGKLISAHRFAWIQKFGEIPEGMCVLHRCDNPSCVNYNHLFLGTNADNVADRHRKGRNARNSIKGERHGMAKLTKQQVEQIRMLAGSKSQSAIATEFGITQSSVSLIVNRVSWT